MFARLSLRQLVGTPLRPLARSLSTHAPPLKRPQSAKTRHLSPLWLASGTLVATTLVVANVKPIRADSEDSTSHAGPSPPLSSLVRSYVVYAMCSIPSLVEWSPTILSTALSIPIVSTVTEAFVRITFFDQFVGAETAEDAIPLVERFRRDNKGCLFAYSVEVDEAEAAGKNGKKGNKSTTVHKQTVEEMIHSIDVAADFEDKVGIPGNAKGRRTWVAVKLTALLPDHILINLSKYLVERRRISSSIAFPGTPAATDLDTLDDPAISSQGTLTTDDVATLKELHADLNRICRHAQERGVKIIIDAEHSWYQPAVDAFALSLMMRYNRPSADSSPAVQPLIYNTYQAYLRRNPEHLAHSIRAAKEGGYALGVKLVRGAYHPHEMEAHAAGVSISSDTLPPVWPTKRETDECYNSCAQVLLDAIAEDIKRSSRRSSAGLFASWFGSSQAKCGDSIPAIGVLFGTHNWKSCRLVLDGLVSRGLAKSEGTTVDGEAVVSVGDDVTERLTLAQLYGMHDNLTDYLVRRTKSSFPFVIKYVPYGSLKEVMPYLSRRAIENKSVLGEGAAAEERRRAWMGIKSKILGL